MKRNSNLLNEVLGDVKAVRETAIQAAMSRLQETFEPTVRNLISQRMAEEEEELPNDDLEVTDMPESNEPIDLDAMDDDPDLDLESVMRELEEEFDDEEEEFEDPAPVAPPVDAPADAPAPSPEPAPFANPAPAAPPVDAPADPIPDIDDEIDDIDNELDEIISELEAELDDDLDPVNEYGNDDDDLEESLSTVKSELTETRKVVAVQKKLINELNLLNSKLLYITKINESYNVSSSQKYKMLGLFDKAHNVREVKLVYAAICESLNKKTTNKAKQPVRRRSIKEGASKPTRTLKENRSNTQQYDFVPRWKKLAGIN